MLNLNITKKLCIAVTVILLCGVTSHGWADNPEQHQHRETFEPVRELVSLLHFVVPSRSETRIAKEHLLQWDCRMDRGSSAAIIFLVWERDLLDTLTMMLVASDQTKFLPISKNNLVGWLREPKAAPSGLFGDNAVVVRDNLLIESLDRAVDRLSAMLKNTKKD